MAVDKINSSEESGKLGVLGTIVDTLLLWFVAVLYIIVFWGLFAKEEDKEEYELQS